MKKFKIQRSAYGEPVLEWVSKNILALYLNLNAKRQIIIFGKRF